MDNVLAWASSIVALGLSILGLIIAIRKAPFDIRLLKLDTGHKETDLAQKYLEMTNKVTLINNQLRDEIQVLRSNLESMDVKHAQELEEIKESYETEMVEIRAALVRSENRAIKVEDWAKRLYAQVESLGAAPVPFEPKIKRTLIG